MKYQRVSNVAVGCALGLFALLGLLSRPVADDFCELVNTRQYGPLGLMTYMWQSWSGRFALFGLKGILYSVTDRALPLITPALLIIVLIIVWQWALKRHLKNAGLVVSSILVASIITLPNIYQVMYWASASYMYFAPLIISGLIVGGISRRWHPVALVVLAFISAGFNEPHACLQIALALIAFWRWRRGELLVVAIATAVGLGMSLLSPGNAIRAAYFPGSRDIITLGAVAIEDTMVRWGQTLVGRPIALALPFVVGWSLAPLSYIRRRKAIFQVLLYATLFVAAGTILPELYATGGHAARASTLSQLIFATSAYLAGSLIGSKRALPRQAVSIVAVIAVITVFSWVANAFPGMASNAIAYDRGHLPNYLADQMHVNNNQDPTFAACIRRM